MKEININIEGYNVNGICVGCLNYNRKMFYHEEIKDCFKLLANIDISDGLTIQVCWECLAAVKNAMLFKEQISNAFDILINYSKEHTFLNSPDDLSCYATQRLTIQQAFTPSESTVKEEEKNDSDNIKEEIDEKIVPVDTFTDLPIVVTTEVKVENDFLTNNDDAYGDYGNDDRLSSDDDKLLSEIRSEPAHKKKKKKIKTKKRTKRLKDSDKNDDRSLNRLKNLPLHLVELYTMSEAEMWEIRAIDVATAEFQKLRYKCELCIMAFNTQALLNTHQNGKHNTKHKNMYQCDVCKSYFLTKDNVAVHRRLHLKGFKCRECGLITSMKRIMLAHNCTAAGTHACPVCDEKFPTKWKLSYHKSVYHQESPQCDCCGKVFANKATLKYHLKLLTQNKSEKEREPQYIPCKGCDKVFTSKKSYRAHVVIHDGLSYPCPTCGKLFQWKRNLTRHVRNHRDRDAGTTHACRDCGKSFASRDCYKNHMKLSKRHVHEQAYAHTCQFCGKKFPTKWCMVDHIDWDHLKRIKYQCSVCFKPFKTAKIMVAHMQNIHEGRNKRDLESEHEHLCDICGKSYKTVKRLKGHVWSMHTQRSDAKTYKCALCPATFAWQTSIYKHMKMMHDNKRKIQENTIKTPRAVSANAQRAVSANAQRAPAKKVEEYPSLEMTNRMQYFQQNVANNIVQNIVQNVHNVQPIQTITIVQHM